ncbi:MAG: class I SAM-dependent methyltransferase [Bryobacterales bacterium]|nr:class I SAM-dependent methyltransferase [Bryobacterales bacterium]
MRSAAKLKLGYYPLVQAEAERIRKFLQFHGEASVLDPCAGTGAALRTITQDAAALRYGIELDSYRAGEAKRALDDVVHGSVFEVHAPVESFSLLYLNPPFDFEIGEGKNQRMERIFLEHVYRWLKQAGVLVMIAPFDRVYECRTVLTPHFRDKAIYRLTELEAVKYKQVVVFGIRRTRQERERLNDHAVQHGNRRLHDLTVRYEEIPPLPETPDREYAVSPSLPAKLEYRGLPLDLTEDLLEKSPAWLQAQRITHAPKTEFAGRPLTPLHRGHVGILCTSGLLNGQFGDESDTHVAYWESVKVVDRTEEEDDSGSTVIREKERFSQRLTLLYADGRIALLSERAASKEAGNAERAPANGEADVRETNARHDQRRFGPSEPAGRRETA